MGGWVWGVGAWVGGGGCAERESEGRSQSPYVLLRTGAVGATASTVEQQVLKIVYYDNRLVKDILPPCFISKVGHGD